MAIINNNGAPSPFLSKFRIKWILVLTGLALALVYGLANSLLFLSYRSSVLGDHEAALSYSSIANRLGGHLYSNSTEKYVEFAKQFALSYYFVLPVDSVYPGIFTDLILKETYQDYVTQARHGLVAMRFSNAHGDIGSAGLIYEILERRGVTEKIDPALHAEISAEMAFDGFQQTVFVLWKRIQKESNGLTGFEQELEKYVTLHKKAQQELCKGNMALCKFNDLRWQMGRCANLKAMGDSEHVACTESIAKEYIKIVGGRHRDSGKFLSCKAIYGFDGCRKLIHGLEPYFELIVLGNGNAGE